MKKLTLFLVILFFSVTGLQAQQTADVNVSATVASALNITTVSDLEVGGLIAGQTKTITNDDSRAGVFEINGNTGLSVDIGFTLPTNLTDGTNLLPITFLNNSGGFNTENNTSGITSFDPNSTISNVSLDNTTGDLYVYIGAQVSAGASQPTGTYNGTITMEVSYY